MKIRIGARDSALSNVQAQKVIFLLTKKNPKLKTEFVPFTSYGDSQKNKPLNNITGKGLWTLELDKALEDKSIDIAVHSLKDVQVCLPEMLEIAAFCAAEDPRDVLVLPAGASGDMPLGAIGCSSKRRSMQLAALYPGVPCENVRGNVHTRISKLDSGEYGALVLAMAGLKRLGLESRASRIFSTDEMLPAAGQGVLAAVARHGSEAARILAEIDEPLLRRRALAERSFTNVLGGGCGTPVAVYAREENSLFVMECRFAPLGDTKMTSGITREECPSLKDAEDLGRRFALRILAENAEKKGKLGSVALVGAGPGGAALLTAGGAAALLKADVVIFDKLIGQSVLAMSPAHSEKIYAGKETGNHLLNQTEINELIIKKAIEGKRVVRLKGGDPFLFGRGCEEALACAAVYVPCEVISGVPAAIAVPAAAGIPVTLRGIASRLHIAAAHGSFKIDFSALARACADGGTLIFMMCAAKLKFLCRSLIEAGLLSSTHAAVISNGTTAKQKAVFGTLESIVEKAADMGCEPPAVFAVGAVCQFAKTLSNAAAKKPLSGIRVAVTRPCGGENRLAALLGEAGAEVIAIPTIKIEALRETPLLRNALDMPQTRWFSFTSVHGVDAFFAKLAEYKVDIRTLADCKFAAAGDPVYAALAERGIIADVLSSIAPEAASGKGHSAALGEALVKAISKTADAKDAVAVLPRSSAGGKTIIQIIEAAGIRVIDIPIYDTVTETGYENSFFRARLTEGVDYVAFTSPSAVKGWVEIFDKKPAAVCIGETTAAAARSHGFNALAAKDETLTGMKEALLKSILGIKSH